MRLVFIIIILTFRGCYGFLSEDNKMKDETKEEEIVSPVTISDAKEFAVENFIQKLEKYALDIEEVSHGEDVNKEEIINKLYGQMIAVLDGIGMALKDKDNVVKLIEVNGLHRIFSVHLYNNHTKFRTTLLLLLKDLLDVIPDTLDTVIPLNIMDRILNIFEKDANLAVKAHALDVLNKWLPRNPIAQLRVMKVKGLDVFYNEMYKLDISAIELLLELFNSIINEHLEARNAISDMTVVQDERLLIYQRMGLMEHLSTSKACSGLLNIFTMLWSYNSNAHGNIKIFYELLQNIKPYCSVIYKKTPKAIKFFETLLEQVKDENKKEYFEEREVSVAALASVVEDYLAKEKKDNVRDEF